MRHAPCCVAVLRRAAATRLPETGPPMTIARCALAFLLSLGGTAPQARESTCYGTPERGRIEDAVSLPLDGANFEAYSTLGWAAGRTYVHSRVHAAVLAAFAQLQRSAPDKVFVYGETGRSGGGHFPPHRTHRNGLSVDLMVPVLREGRSVPLPRSLLNRYGYDLEFDDAGRLGEHRIDFEALAAWLDALEAAARDQGIGIRRVIFEVPLQRHLFATATGRRLRDRIAFSTRPAWVRHDEHFHVDFAVPCERG
jgi:penicillin-insensitive murein endopeptidase